MKPSLGIVNIFYHMTVLNYTRCHWRTELAIKKSMPSNLSCRRSISTCTLRSKVPSHEIYSYSFRSPKFFTEPVVAPIQYCQKFCLMSHTQYSMYDHFTLIILKMYYPYKYFRTPFPGFYLNSHIILILAENCFS